MDGWVDRVAWKRLSHESSHRLQRIVLGYGPGHRDYEIARAILTDRLAKIDFEDARKEQERLAHDTLEHAASDDELDRLLDELPQADGGRAEVAPSEFYKERVGSTRDYKDTWAYPAESRCSHEMTPVTGVERLFGSSYRGGVRNEGTVAVIMTPEALPMVIRPGWSSVPGLEGFGLQPSAVIYWPWRDQSVPKDPVDAVRKIVSLHRLHRMGETLEVACFGGHGRTGTLLAVLAAMAAGWTSNEAVARLRDAYCAKAIETKEQEGWVEKAIQGARLLLAGTQG